MSYEMIWEKRGVYRRYYGHSSDLEVSESVNLTHSSDKFDELRYVILDFLDVTAFEVTSHAFIQETSALDAAAAHSNPNIKIAVVAADPEITTLAKEYIANELTPYPTRIYSNMADARNWVSVCLPPQGRSRKIM